MTDRRLADLGFSSKGYLSEAVYGVQARQLWMVALKYQEASPSRRQLDQV